MKLDGRLDGPPFSENAQAKANVWISCPSTGASTHYDMGYNLVLQLFLGLIHREPPLSLNIDRPRPSFCFFGDLIVFSLLAVGPF